MLVFLGIGRKRHRDHVGQRHDVEDQDANARQRHQGDVEVAVKQGFHILDKARHMFPGFDHPLQAVGFLHLQHPEQDDGCDDKQRDYPGKKNLLGIVTGGVFVDLLGLIPDLALLFCAKARQHRQVIRTACDHKEQKGNFAQKNSDSLDHLAVSDQPDPHDNGGKPGPQIPVLQCSAHTDFFVFHDVPLLLSD